MARTICICIEWLSDEHKVLIDTAAAMHGFTAEYYGTHLTDNLRECLQRAEVLFAHSPELLDAAGPQLQWYCCSFAGVDPYCRQPELFANPACLLTNSSGAYDETIAEHLVMATLMLLRRIPEYTQVVAARGWENQLPIRSIREVQIGVLGAGNIGSAFAEKALALGARPIIGINRSGRAREPFGEVVPFSQLNSVLSRIDVLVAAMPGTSETAQVLNAQRLALLPQGAVVLNIGRGSAIDQAALIDALERGHLAGAALDVMTPEPLPANNPLWSAKNILITPHISGNMTMGWTRDECVRLFLEDLANYANGRPLARLVDRDLGY